MTSRLAFLASFALSTGCTALDAVLDPTEALPILESATVAVDGEDGNLMLSDSLAAIEYSDDSFDGPATLTLTALGDPDAPVFLVEVDGAAIVGGVGLLVGFDAEAVETADGSLASPLAFVHGEDGRVDIGDLRGFATIESDDDTWGDVYGGWLIGAPGLVQLLATDTDVTMSASTDVVSATNAAGQIDGARTGFDVAWEVDASWAEQARLGLPGSDVSLRIEDVGFGGTTPLYGGRPGSGTPLALFDGDAVSEYYDLASFTSATVYSGSDLTAQVGLEAPARCVSTGAGYATLVYGTAIRASLDALPAAELLRWDGAPPTADGLRVKAPDPAQTPSAGVSDDVNLAWIDEARWVVDCG